jgi:hypothetical protein
VNLNPICPTRCSGCPASPEYAVGFINTVFGVGFALVPV